MRNGVMVALVFVGVAVLLLIVAWKGTYSNVLGVLIPQHAATPPEQKPANLAHPFGDSIAPATASPAPHVTTPREDVAAILQAIGASLGALHG